MATNDNQNEYTFEDHEDTTQSKEYTESSYSGGTENFNTILKNKRIVGAVGILFAIWIISYISDALFGSSNVIVEKKDSSSDIKSATNELTDLTAENTASDPVAVPIAADNIAQNKNDNIQNSKLDDIHSTLSSHEQNLSDVTNTLNMVNQRLDQISNSIGNLTNSVNDISNEQNETGKKISVIEKQFQKKEPKKPVAEAQQKSTVQYYIKAAIIGRAWLADANNKYITVAEGDSVAGYGKVIKIHPNKGIITTSSGRNITFSEE